MMGLLPPKPKDPWNKSPPDEEMEAPEPNPDSYDTCYAEPEEPEPEVLCEADIHGARYISKNRLFHGSASSSSTTDSGNWDKGQSQWI